VPISPMRPCFLVPGFPCWCDVIVLVHASLVAWSLECAVRQRGRCLGGREPRVMIRLSRAASL